MKRRQTVSGGRERREFLACDMEKIDCRYAIYVDQYGPKRSAPANTTHLLIVILLQTDLILLPRAAMREEQRYHHTRDH